MMIEKVMIQLGPNKYTSLKSSGGVGGEGGSFPCDDRKRKVVIQLGAKNLKSSCRMMIETGGC